MALKKGMIVAAITAVAYLAIVVITTPNLSPEASLRAALAINSPIIVGISIGVGAQIFISSYGKSMGCRLHKKKEVFNAGSGGTVVSSFFSFFFLVPLGCCGSWLLILSYLPLVFGNTLSVVLVKYSVPFSYFGLATVLSFVTFSAYKLYREIKLRDKGVQKIQERTKIERK